MRKKILAAILGILMIAGIFAVSAVAADERTDAYFIVNGVEYAWNEQTYLGAVGTGGTSADDIKVVEVYNVNEENNLVFDMLIPGYTFQYCTIKLNNCTVNSGNGWTIGGAIENANIELYMNNCHVEKLNIYAPGQIKSCIDLYCTRCVIDDSFNNALGDATFDRCEFNGIVNQYSGYMDGHINAAIDSKGTASEAWIDSCTFANEFNEHGKIIAYMGGFGRISWYMNKYQDGTSADVQFKWDDNRQTNLSYSNNLQIANASQYQCVGRAVRLWHNKTITIDTPEELVEFAQVSKGGASCNKPGCTLTNHSFEGQTIKLGKSLDLGTINGEEGWWYYQDANKKIDNRIVDFKGTFDGQGYTISKMKYYDYNGSEKESTNSFVSMGMFRTLYGNVKNLTIDTVGSFLNEDGTLQTHLTGKSAPRVVFFALAYKTRGSHIYNVHVKNVNILIDNAGVDYSTDALTSANGLVGVVTWDNEVNDYGNTTQYSYFEDCTVEKFFAKITGNCGYAGGAFAYKASEMSVFENCNVKAALVTIGGSVDNYGGFIGEIGLASTVTNCHVSGFALTADQNNAAVGGFMGDTVGGTGWGDSVHITGCTVADTRITIETVNAPIGGFVGDLIGGRSAIFTNNSVADNVTLNGDVVGARDGIGTPCIGGFIGGLYGRDDLVAYNEHQFNGCSAAAKIDAGEAPAGGFVGAAVKGENNQMRVSFINCTSNSTVRSNGEAVAFVNFNTGRIGDKPADLTVSKGKASYDVYENCTSTASTYGLAPQNVEPVMSTGGNSSYSRTLSNGYVELTDTTATKTTYTTFQDPAMQTFRLRRAPVEIDKVVEVEFYRKNAAGEYELWRTIELFKDTAFDGTGYPYAATYADYRIAGGLASVLDQADELFFKATAIGFIDENGNPFTDSTIVGSDIKLYAEYGFEVTYEFEGSIPEGVEVPAGKFYQAGETVELPTVSNVDNYEFRGWNIPAGFVMTEENLTVTGKWVKIAKPEITGKVKYNDVLEAGKFTFILVDEEGQEVARTTNDKDGNFKFNLKLDQGNRYSFTVKQVEGNETLRYDLTSYDVLVIVDDNGELVMVSENILYKNRVPHRANVAIEGTVTLDGEAADGFEFVLTDKRGNVVATTESENGEIRFDLTYDFTGKRQYLLKQISADGVVCDDVVYEIEVVVKSIGSGYKAQVAYIGTEALEFSNTSAN